MIGFKKIFLLLILFIVIIPVKVNANITCNDGTISPTCSDCHQGCCSHHGGCLPYNNYNSSSESSNDAVGSLLVVGLVAAGTSIAYSNGKKKDQR